MSGPQVRVIAGGTVDATEQAAIVEAVSRALAARERRRSAPGSDWARAGRLEAGGATTVRSRAGLPPA